MIRSFALIVLIFGVGLNSFGQNCLDLFQLERMLLSSVSYKEVDGFLQENSYYTASKGSSTIMLEGDSVSTVYFKNAYNNNYASIHNRVGTTSRIVVYKNTDCLPQIQQKLNDERYVLIKNEGNKTYRKGNNTVLTYPDGTLVLYGKEIADFRLATQKQREKRQALLARLEVEFDATVELYKTKLVNYKINPDSSNYRRLYYKFNYAVSEQFKTRVEYVSLSTDIINLWKVKLTNEVNVHIANFQFAQALDAVNNSTYPYFENISELLNLIVDKRLHHELSVMEESLKEAVLVKNYPQQIDLAAKIIAHPKVSMVQKSYAEKASLNAKETMQLIAKRKTSTISYWQHFPDKKVKVERLLQKYLLTKVERQKKGEFVFALRVDFDTAGVGATKFAFSSEDDELKSAINNLLTPVVMSNLYFRATDTIYFYSTWSTDRHVAVRKYQGTNYSNLSLWNSDINNLITNSTSKYGTFKFDVHQVTVNGIPYSSIEFVKHRVGKSVLSNVVKSLVVPGLGRRAANYGRPNKKLQEVLIIGGAAVGAELLSQGYMSQYNNQGGTSFDEAQNWHRTSLVAAAILAVDYINEQFYVLIKSFSNLSYSRKTNNELKFWTKSDMTPLSAHMVTLD